MNFVTTKLCLPFCIPTKLSVHSWSTWRLSDSNWVGFRPLQKSRDWFQLWPAFYSTSSTMAAAVLQGSLLWQAGLTTASEQRYRARQAC